MNDESVDTSLVLVQDGTLVCPYCGTSGLENFYYAEDVMNFRELVGLEDGQLTIQSHYSVADDGDNPRLGCKKCDKECLIPEDLDHDFV